MSALTDIVPYDLQRDVFFLYLISSTESQKAFLKVINDNEGQSVIKNVSNPDQAGKILKKILSSKDVTYWLIQIMEKHDKAEQKKMKKIND